MLLEIYIAGADPVYFYYASYGDGSLQRWIQLSRIGFIRRGESKTQIIVK